MQSCYFNLNNFEMLLQSRIKVKQAHAWLISNIFTRDNGPNLKKKTNNEIQYSGFKQKKNSQKSRNTVP